VNYRQRVRLLIVLLAAVCGLLVWGLAYFRQRSLGSVDSWMTRLPDRDAMLVYLDFSALRQSGVTQLLANAGTAEPEYQAFVNKTGFDYARDLDAVLASFGPAGKYFIVKGRFNWKLLQAYAASQDGHCLYTFCTVNGSTPERKISYFPLARGLMGLAVSKDGDAAEYLMRKESRPITFVPPAKPAWVYLPGSLLRNNQGLPSSTRVLASVLENAQGLLFTLGAARPDFEAELEVRCRSEKDAADLELQLRQAITLLKETMRRDHRVSDGRDLSGVLAAGVFRHTGATVMGSWPIPRVFLEAVLGA
jgi:hypothetical protein